MFKTKQEVDKHVNNSLKRINNETERNLRCYSFAKLYFNVGDYEQTVRYVTSYLSVKPKSPEGHNLLGKALEKLGKKQAALEAYRTSLQQDSKQNNLVIKVCELMAQDNVDIDNFGARYFCDLAQSLDPQNPIVLNLKEKLITNDSKDPTEVSQFLLKELENRPTDVNLRVRLLKHFLENNMIKEAYKHACDIEQKKLGIFDTTLAWYETFAEVLVRYQRDASITSQLTWEFWFLSASVLEKLAALSLNDHSENIKSSSDYILAVFNFDQSLLKATQSVDSCPDKALLREFLSHYEAQLNLHLAVLAFKQAKQDLMKFKEVQNLILPVLFMAYNVGVPDTQAVWFNNLPEKRRLMVAGWHKEASFRCSQAGNVLLGLSKDRRNILIEKAAQYSAGMWREQLFKKLFVKRDQQMKAGTSFFVSSSLEPTINLPEYRDLIKYNEVAQVLHPSSLHHYIWLALNYNSLSDFTLCSFDGLQYTVKNLPNCGAESLNVLDVQSFIYCATLCAQSKLKNADTSLTYFHQDRTSVLPVCITANLGTLNQSKFLLAAYKMYKHEYTSNLSEIRMILINGIEVIRCVGNHGLDVKLLVTLATIFAEKVKSLTKQSEIDANYARAELYWKTALPLLERLKNEHALIYPNKRLFEYKCNKELTQAELANYINQARLFIGMQHMRKKELEKAMHIFEGLKDPYASFYQSQIYKQMADAKTNHSRENVTSEMRSQNIILLSRARDCLYLTLDRLRDPSQDRDHPLNAQLGTEIEKTERLLSRIDPDCTNRNEDGMSDENVSDDDSAGDHYLSTYTHHVSFPNGRDMSVKNDTLHLHSTPLRSVPRQEARPSPERLDAQLRQLIASRDVAMNSVLEQNKLMTELQRSLTDEIRGFKDAVKHLTSAVDERSKMFTGDFNDVKKMMDDLTHSVDDRLQSVTDMVQEMKKELNEIKKEQTKNSKISIDDLYDLGNDGDYGSSLDLNLGAANFANGQSMVSNLYPNFHPRLPQAPQVPNLAAYGGQSLYQNPYTSLPYPYGLGQPGVVPFATPEHPQPLGQPPMFPMYNNPSTMVSNDALRHLAAQVQLGQSAVKGDSPKTLLQPGFGVTPSTVSSQAKEPVKPSSILPVGSISTTTTPTFGSSSFLGQNLNISSPATISSSVAGGFPSTKAPPVNVVITSSDPLPSFSTTTTQPILSVTIPPQHIKGNLQKPTATVSQPSSQAHNYQISLPTANVPATAPSFLNQPPPVISTQSLLSNVPSPAFSAIAKTPTTVNKNVSLGIEIEKALDKTFSPSDRANSSLNRSGVSTTSVDEYDPRPDFQPIVPLPDEVPVTTGEEKEVELFCQRCKLFRLVPVSDDAKEWKERGIGNIKILSNPETKKVRILMRREQVHKICANHFLTKDMVLTPRANNDRAYIWAAYDFADEKVVLEKFCARFKTAEEAKKFADAFHLAKTKIKDEPAPAAQKVLELEDISAPSTPESSPVNKLASANLGGFKFINKPTFKPKIDEKTTTQVEEVAKPAAQPSPFAAFTFGNKSAGTPTKNLFGSLTSEAKFSPSWQNVPTVSAPATVTSQKDEEETDDFVPTVEFRPVIDKLPDLVEVKTGEENAEVLFEERSKLFRLDTAGDKTEWKERGVGNIKILKESGLRLIMRREQVHKVCLNHQILKNMVFKKNSLDPKAIIWSAQDFSEGMLKSETFMARFKNEELSSQFLKTLQSSQTNLDESNQVTFGKHHKPEPTLKIGFGDKLKAAKGGWQCKNCYIFNEGKINCCEACDTPKTPKKDEPTFSFSVKPFTESSKQEDKNTTGWGNKFKPATGSWDCQTCYVNNSADKTKCISCETPKDGVTGTETASISKGVSLDTGGLTFNFGVPSTTASSSAVTLTPIAPATAEPKVEQPIQKFSFSIPLKQPEPNSVLSGFGDSFKPKAGTWECEQCYIRNEPASLYCLSCEAPKDATVPKKEASAPKGINLETPGLKFNFGMPPASSTAAATITSGFNFGNADTTKPFSWKTVEPADVEPTKPQETSITLSPQSRSFDFKPNSPRRISTGQGDESDASYVEEEEINVHFKPVVPLPDIVEVKTGEENEQVLYSHRAKLFRYVAGEWKERGLGDVKVLKDNATGKLRVVMRREQVLKICLNHWLTKDVDYKRKDEKTWLFHAADFSEGELNRDQFCLRFKNAEIAGEFKRAVDDALSGNVGEQRNKQDETLNAAKESDSDDVIFVSETQVSPEDEKEATKLMLPPKFMAYRQRPDCTCEQCKKDDEYYNQEPKTSISTSVPSKPSSSTSIFGTPGASLGTPSSGGSVFGSPAAASFTFGTPGQSSTTVLRSPHPETLRDLLQKGSKTTPKNVSSSFSSLKTESGATPTSASLVMATATSSAKEDDTKTNQATPTNVGSGFLFGKTGLQKSGSLFGQGSNIFDSSNTSSNIFSNSFSKEPTSNIFSSSAKQGSIFGTNSTDTSKESSSSIFNTPKEKSSSIFGTPKENRILEVSKEASTPNIFKTSNSSIFGSPKEAVSASGGNIFGSGDDTRVTTTSHVFGAKPVIGSSDPNAKPATNIFATKPNIGGKDSPANLFSTSSSNNTNIFGTAAKTTNSSIFGSSTDNIFGAKTSSSLFDSGSKQSSSSIFGGGQTTLFGNKVQPKVTDANMTFGSTTMATVNLKETDDVVLNSDSGLSFASLAAQVASESATKQDTTAFDFLGAGAPVFGGSSAAKPDGTSPSKKAEQTGGGSEEEDEGTADGGEHDPHFEPIVPLPDQIVVSTGEEEEKVLFNERAKLFRFDADTKEWKERGIGQFKVLFHPNNKTYRLLLRREQVHKVVLNQRVMADLDLQPMATSDKAWVWAGINYTEENETKLEKLAVRFKNQEIATAFKDCMDEVIKQVVEIQLNKSTNSEDNLPTTVSDFRVEGDVDDDEEEEEDDDEEDDDDDDDNRNIMFTKRCTLSEQTESGSWQQVCMGNLQVYYDPELYAARICILDDAGHIASNSVIGMNTEMEVTGKECQWRTVEWADGHDVKWRSLKATFSSAAAAEELHSNYLEGINYAQEIGIFDDLPSDPLNS